MNADDFFKAIEKQPHFAILNEKHEVVPVRELIEWAVRFKTEMRQVARDNVQGFVVSTIFLGINHGSYPRIDGTFSPPLWFETMVFREDSGGEVSNFREYETQHYETWDEALLGHKLCCDAVKSGEIGE